MIFVFSWSRTDQFCQQVIYIHEAQETIGYGIVIKYFPSGCTYPEGSISGTMQIYTRHSISFLFFFRMNVHWFVSIYTLKHLLHPPWPPQIKWGFFYMSIDFDDIDSDFDIRTKVKHWTYILFVLFLIYLKIDFKRNEVRLEYLRIIIMKIYFKTAFYDIL